MDNSIGIRLPGELATRGTIQHADDASARCLEVKLRITVLNFQETLYSVLAVSVQGEAEQPRPNVRRPAPRGGQTAVLSHCGSIGMPVYSNGWRLRPPHLPAMPPASFLFAERLPRVGEALLLAAECRPERRSAGPAIRKSWKNK
jgi:hypothetical protein